MEKLREDWDGATNGVCGCEVSDKWWGIITEKFSQRERLYHNEQYISDILTLYQKYKQKFSSPQAVSLAIFFHKLEYDPRTGDGDARSLEQFNKFMAEAGEQAQKSSLYTESVLLLEACSSNLTEAHMTVGGSGSEDQHYLLDILVAVLGAPPHGYHQYTNNIQAEYSHLSPQAFTQLRLKILQSLLLIPNVYATQDFQQLYEKQARDNIAEEIEKLKKQ